MHASLLLDFPSSTFLLLFSTKLRKRKNPEDKERKRIKKKGEMTNKNGCLPKVGFDLNLDLSGYRFGSFSDH